MGSMLFNKNYQLRSGWKILMVVILSLIYLLIISFAFKSLGIRDKYGVSIFLAFFAAVCTMLIFIDKERFSYLGLDHIKKGYAELIIGLLAGAFFIMLNVFILHVLKFVSFSNNILRPNISMALLEGLCLFFIVAFAEELLFRSYIIMSLQQMGKGWLSIFISALIFALTHGALNDNISLLAVINILLAGILLGYMFLKTKSIYMPIGFHITWNYFQGYILGVNVSGREVGKAMYLINMEDNFITGGAFGFEGGLVNTFIILLSIFFVFLYCKNKKEEIYTFK